MQYYVERSVNGRLEWLAISPVGEIWVGAFFDWVEDEEDDDDD